MPTIVWILPQNRCPLGQSNGRDSLCGQKQLIRKDVIEIELLADIKRQLLAPEFAKEMAREIRKRVDDRPPSTTKKDIAKLDRQIQNVVDSLTAAGQSDALTAKLRDLEERKATLASDLEQISTPVDLCSGAQDKWREIVSNLENIHKYAKPDEVEIAREALKGIIGQVTVAEEKHHVVAYPMLGNNVVYNSGAQKRT